MEIDENAKKVPESPNKKDKPKKKRKRNHDESSKAKKSKSRESPPPSLQDCVNPNELHCVICMDFPVGEIFQCTNSHLLCSSCHQRILESVNCLCPTCRVKLSRDHPSRNRLAEHVLKNYVVACTNDGCDAQVQYGNLVKHETEQCPHRITKCKYNPIGCEWSGIAQKLKNHQKKCEMISKTPKCILKRVNALNREQEKAKYHREKLLSADRRVVELLSRRNRNIMIKDVVVKDDEHYGVSCTDTFLALGRAWELYLQPIKKSSTSASSSSNSNNNNSSSSSSSSSHWSSRYFESPRNSRQNMMASNSLQTDFSSSNANANGAGNNNGSSSTANGPTEQKQQVARAGVKLRCVSSIKRKLRVEFCILPGPQLGMNLRPSFHKFVFRSNQRASDLYELPVSDTESTELLEGDNANFRILMFDKNGGLDRSFSTQGNGSTSGRTGSDDDSDMDLESESELSMLGDSDDGDGDETFESSLSSDEYESLEGDDEDEYGVMLL